MTAIVSSLSLLVLGCVLLCQSIGSDGNAQNALDHRYEKSCEGPDKHIILDCTHTSKIKVTSTCYGGSAQHVCTPKVHSCYRRNAEDEYFSDIKEKVATQCDGQWKCQFPVSRHFLGNPPYLQYRTFLEVKYDCVAIGRQWPATNRLNVYACEGGIIHLFCHRRLIIDKAQYGRRPNNRCDPDVMGSERNRRTCYNNVTDQLRTWCDGKVACRIEVTRDMFSVSNQCENTYKYLEVKYHCE